MKLSLLSLAFQVPVAGWMLKDAIHGAPDAKYYFAGNVVLLAIIAVALKGYAALIIMALTAAACVLIGLVVLTGSDLVTQFRRSRQATRPIDEA